MTNNRPSLNYWLKTVLSQFTLETFKGLQLKCLGSVMDHTTINEQYIQIKGGKSLQLDTNFWVFYNPGHNILRHIDVWQNFCISTSETNRDYW